MILAAISGRYCVSYLVRWTIRENGQQSRLAVCRVCFFSLSRAPIQLCLRTFPGFPPKIRITVALSLSTSGKDTRWVAIPSKGCCENQNTHCWPWGVATASEPIAPWSLDPVTAKRSVRVSVSRAEPYHSIMSLPRYLRVRQKYKLPRPMAFRRLWGPRDTVVTGTKYHLTGRQHREAAQDDWLNCVDFRTTLR